MVIAGIDRLSFFHSTAAREAFMAEDEFSSMLRCCCAFTAPYNLLARAITRSGAFPVAAGPLLQDLSDFVLKYSAHAISTSRLRRWLYR
jgi:hypothetical protein